MTYFPGAIAPTPAQLRELPIITSALINADVCPGFVERIIMCAQADVDMYNMVEEWTACYDDRVMQFEMLTQIAYDVIFIEHFAEKEEECEY